MASTSHGSAGASESDVDAVCAAYASALRVQFSAPGPALGNARKGAARFAVAAEVCVATTVTGRFSGEFIALARDRG